MQHTLDINLYTKILREPPRFKVIINTKKNLTTISVQDGYIPYKITYNPALSCQCKKSNLCQHILYVLIHLCKLSLVSIKYLNKVYPIFINCMDTRDPNIENILSDEIHKLFNDNECGICLTTLNQENHKMALHECKLCHNYVHIKCSQQWDTALNRCIYCRH